MKKLLTIRVLVIVCVLSLTQAVFADDKPEPRLITVTGEAEVKVVPDEVVFDLAVQAFNRDLHVAKMQTDDSLKKVIELTRKYHIAQEDVQTDYIKLEPRYKGGNEGRTFLGYFIRKDVVFTLRDVTQAENLLSEVMESGISQINGVRFQTSQLRKYRDQARAQAIRAAREKAVALTAEIGQTIGKAYSILEVAPTRYAMNQNATNLSNFSIADTGDESEGTLALGRIKINARVEVRFELQ
jgi:uncharacterized protein